MTLRRVTLLGNTVRVANHVDRDLAFSITTLAAFTIRSFAVAVANRTLLGFFHSHILHEMLAGALAVTTP